MKHFIFLFIISLIVCTSCHDDTLNNTNINLGTPSNLIAQGISTHKVKLTWSIISNNATGYKVERKTQGNFILIATVGLQNNYIDSTVSENTQYTYRVCSYNGAINSNYTNEVTIFTGSSILPNPNDTTRICSQTWMTKNLDVAYYRNGDPIPQVIDPDQWSNLTTGAWCYYNNDPSTADVYGKLYNWHAINDPRGLAPEGWHLPSMPEFQSLRNCLSGASVAGGKMKEVGTSHWISPNAGANNSSGFTALPGGFRKLDGEFYSLGVKGYWYTSTSFLDNTGTLIIGTISLSSSTPALTETISGSNVASFYNNGLSVRCILGRANNIEISTNQHSNLTATSVQSGGYISNDGGYPISSRGVVWSTSPSPSINLVTKTSDGTGMGSFASNINGLSPNTTYYIRAYASNLIGTVYGNEDTIYTANYTTPTIVTKAISLITHSGCVSGASSINNGNNPISSKGVVWSTSPNPTISLTTKTFDGTGSLLFNSNVTGLSTNTTYYLRAYATNSAGTGYGNEIVFRTSDIQSVAICDQVWTSKNLNVSTYSNGDPIPQITDSAAWVNSTTGAWCYYNNDPAMGVIYGKLYNWYAVNDPRGLAPNGWHIPSNNEWDSLVYCYVSNNNCPSYNTSAYRTINAALQATGNIEAGTGLWHRNNSFIATNSSGFTALPGPVRNFNGDPGGFNRIIGYWGLYWTSSVSQTFPSSPVSFIISISGTNSPCGTAQSKQDGYSVRCVKN